MGVRDRLMTRGKLIVVEGIDGAGKSTQLAAILDYLQSNGIGCSLTKQPSDWYRQQEFVRNYLDFGVLPCEQSTLAMFAAADRMFHIETVIEPRLTSGGYVLCDRYVYSSLAYFG